MEPRPGRSGIPRDKYSKAVAALRSATAVHVVVGLAMVMDTLRERSFFELIQEDKFSSY